MPFRGESSMDKRQQFLIRALAEGANVSEVCDTFTISRSTGYRLLERYRREGDIGLVPHSRRPQTSPARTSDEMERLVVEMRLVYPSWGGRKIHTILQRQRPTDAIPALPARSPRSCVATTC